MRIFPMPPCFLLYYTFVSVDISEVFRAVYFAYAAVCRILFLLIPLRRVVKPPQEKCPQCRPVSENKKRIHALALEIAVNRAHELMYPYRHIKGAFTERKPRIKLALISRLAQIFIVFHGIFIFPFLLGERIKKSVLLFHKSDILADIGDFQMLIELLARLSRA